MCCLRNYTQNYDGPNKPRKKDYNKCVFLNGIYQLPVKKTIIRVFLV